MPMTMTYGMSDNRGGRDGTLEIDPLRMLRPRVRKQIMNVMSGLSSRVMVSAPQGSGKTSILLELFRNGDIPDGRTTLLINARTFRKNEFKGVSQHIVELARLHAPEHDFLDLKSVLDYYDDIVVDNAQMYFFDVEFWPDIIKSTSKAKCLFFATYKQDCMDEGNPAVADKLTLADLRMDKDEEEDLILKLRQLYSNDTHQRIFEVILPTIRRDADGYLGLFRFFMEHLLVEFGKQLIPSEVDINMLLEYYRFAMFDYRFPIVQRFFSLFPKMHQDPEAFAQYRPILEKLYANEIVKAPIAESQSEEAKNIRKLIRSGVVVPVEKAAGIEIAFATPMHRFAFFRVAFPSACITEQDMPTSLVEWVLMVLSTFEPKFLSNASCHGTEKFPKEGPLQQQFWRGICMLTPGSVQAAAEVSFVSNAEGIEEIKIRDELDWWVNAKLRWAISILRCGAVRQEHINQLKPNGKYQRLKPRQWLVINFRPPYLKQETEDLSSTPPYYVSVVINRNFQSAMVHFKGRKPFKIKFHGKLSNEKLPKVELNFDHLTEELFEGSSAINRKHHFIPE